MFRSLLVLGVLLLAAQCLAQEEHPGTMSVDFIRALTETRVTIFNLAGIQVSAPSATADTVDFNRPDELKISASGISLSSSFATLGGSEGVTLASGSSATISADGAATLVGQSAIIGGNGQTTVSSALGSIQITAGQEASIVGSAVNLALGLSGLQLQSAGDLSVDASGTLQMVGEVVQLSGWFDTLLQSANGNVNLVSQDDFEVSSLAVSVVGVGGLSFFGSLVQFQAANDIRFAVNTALINSGSSLSLVSYADDVQLQAFADLDLTASNLLSFTSIFDQLNLLSDSGDINFVTNTFNIQSFSENIQLTADQVLLSATNVQFGISQTLTVATTELFTSNYNQLDIGAGLLSINAASAGFSAATALNVASSTSSVYFTSVHEHTGSISMNTGQQNIQANQFDLVGGLVSLSTGATTLSGSVFTARALTAPQSSISLHADTVVWDVAADLNIAGGSISLSSGMIDMSSGSIAVQSQNSFVNADQWNLESQSATISFTAQTIEWTGSASLAAQSVSWSAGQQRSATIAASNMDIGANSGDVNLIGQGQVQFTTLDSFSLLTTTFQSTASSIVNIHGHDHVLLSSTGTFQVDSAASMIKTATLGSEQTDSISFSAASSLSLIGSAGNTATWITGDLRVQSSVGDVTLNVTSLGITSQGPLVNLHAQTSAAFESGNQLDLNGHYLNLFSGNSLIVQSSNEISISSGYEGGLISATGTISVNSVNDANIFATGDILFNANGAASLVATTNNIDINSGGRTALKSINGSVSVTGTQSLTMSSASDILFDISGPASILASQTASLSSQSGSTWSTNQLSVTSFGATTLEAGSNVIFDSQNTGVWSSANHIVSSVFSDYVGGDISVLSQGNLFMSPSTEFIAISRASNQFSNRANQIADGILLASSESSINFQSSFTAVRSGSILFETQGQTSSASITLTAQSINLISRDEWTTIESGGLLSIDSDAMTINSARDVQIQTSGYSIITANTEISVVSQAGDISLLAQNGCARINTTNSAADILVQTTLPNGAPITVSADQLVYLRAVSGALSISSGGGTLSWVGIEGQSLIDRDGISLHTTDISGNIVIASALTTSITTNSRVNFDSTGNFTALFTGSSGAVFTGQDLDIGSTDGYTLLRGAKGVTINSLGSVLLDSTGTGSLVAQDQIRISGSPVSFAANGGALNMVSALNNNIRFASGGDFSATAGGSGLALRSLQDLTITANTGSINFAGSRGVSFDTKAGPISLIANTNGFLRASENINLLSGGDLSINTLGDFVVTAIRDISVNSVLGNVTYTAQGTATFNGASSITLQSEGRSLSKIANNRVTLQSAEIMSITSNNQDVYLDGQSVTIGLSTRPVVTFNAGGSAQVAGFVTRSSGSIELDTSSQIQIASQQIVFAAAVKEQFSTFGPITLSATTSFDIQAPVGSLIVAANQQANIDGEAGVNLISQGPTLIQSTGINPAESYIELSANANIASTAENIDLSASSSISLTVSLDNSSLAINAQRSIDFTTIPTSNGAIRFDAVGSINFQSAIVSQYTTQSATSPIELTANQDLTLLTSGQQSDIFLSSNGQLLLDLTDSIVFNAATVRVSANNDLASTPMTITALTGTLELRASSEVELSSSSNLVSYSELLTRVDSNQTLIESRRSLEISINGTIDVTAGDTLTVSNTRGLGGSISMIAPEINQPDITTENTFSASRSLTLTSTNILIDPVSLLSFETQGYQSSIQIQAQAIEATIGTTLSITSGISDNQVDQGNILIQTLSGDFTLETLNFTITSRKDATTITSNGTLIEAAAVSIEASGSTEEFGFVNLDFANTLQIDANDGQWVVNSASDIQASAQSISIQSDDDVIIHSYSYNQGIYLNTPAANSSILWEVENINWQANNKLRLIGGDMLFEGLAGQPMTTLQVATVTPIANDNDGIVFRAQSGINLTPEGDQSTYTFNAENILFNGLGTVRLSTISNIVWTAPTFTANTLQTTFGPATSALLMNVDTASIVATRELYVLAVEIETQIIDVTASGPIKAFETSPTSVASGLETLVVRAVDSIEVLSIPFINVGNTLDLTSTRSGHISLSAGGNLDFTITDELDINTGGSQLYHAQAGPLDITTSSGPITLTTNDGSAIFRSTTPNSDCVFSPSTEVTCNTLGIRASVQVSVNTIEAFVHIHHMRLSVLNNGLFPPALQQSVRAPGGCTASSGVCPCPNSQATAQAMRSALLGYNLVSAP